MLQIWALPFFSRCFQWGNYLQTLAVWPKWALVACKTRSAYAWRQQFSQHFLQPKNEKSLTILTVTEIKVVGRSSRPQSHCINCVVHITRNRSIIGQSQNNLKTEIAPVILGLKWNVILTLEYYNIQWFLPCAKNRITCQFRRFTAHAYTQKLSSTKPVLSTKKNGDHCSKLLKHFNENKRGIYGF